MPWDSTAAYKIVLFYRYFRCDDPEALKAKVEAICEASQMLGRVLVSPEGVNGTLAASFTGMDEFVSKMEEISYFSPGKVDWKYSLCPPSDVKPFHTLSVRVVKSIIGAGTDGEKVINSVIRFDDDAFGGLSGTGQHLSPQEWDTALRNIKSEDNAVVVDIRNHYEVNVGRFEGAVSVGTNNYSETWKNLDRICGLDDKCKEEEGESSKPKTVFMYCTGGIRCEKASAYLKAKGVPEVYHLQGGIHRYLEQFSSESGTTTTAGEGLFKGKNYTFDTRVAPGAATLDYEEGSSLTPNKAIIASSREGGNTASSSPTSSSICGRCLYCASPHDIYSGTLTCTVCRVFVLVCPPCVEANPYQGEYHCKDHFHLRNCYFTMIDRFDRTSLVSHRDNLQALHDSWLPRARASKEEAKAAAAHKYSRKSARKQIEKIETRLAEIDAMVEKGGEVSLSMPKNNKQVSWWVKETAGR